MEREILLRQLVEAEQSVAESKGFIAQHQGLIVQSERDAPGCRRGHSLAGQVTAAPAVARARARKDSRRAF